MGVLRLLMTFLTINGFSTVISCIHSNATCFLEDKLPVLLEDVPLHIRRQLAGKFSSQSTFLKPLDWTAESGCLATEVT
jgi:hypothetical protein